MPKKGMNDADFLWRWGAKEILLELDQNGPKRFTELLQLKGKSKIFKSSTTLTERLKELTVLGLIRKHVINNPTSRIIISYEITDAGKQVLNHLKEIEKVIQHSKLHLEV